jgi:hypothetical protein
MLHWDWRTATIEFMVRRLNTYSRIFGLTTESGITIMTESGKVLTYE